MSEALIPLSAELRPSQSIFENAELGHGLFLKSSHLVGFGFDGTACFRKGSRDGPDAIREASAHIESYSPYLDADLSEIAFFDCGNLCLGGSDDVERQWAHASVNLSKMLDSVDLVKNDIRLLTFGGEHSISYSPICSYLKQYHDLVVVHLDAHADLRDGYEGYQYSHASIIYRIQEHFSSENRLIQYGIRSGTKEEYSWMNKNNTLSHSLKEFLFEIDQLDDNTPIYLTFDLDYFDPAFFPGTGTPEPGGEDFHSFISLVKLLKNKNLVACDVVELAPNIDSTGNSDVLAAKVVRELLLCLQSTRSANEKWEHSL